MASAADRVTLLQRESSRLTHYLHKPRHNYRYMCAELIRLYSRGQELLSNVYNPLFFNTSPFLTRRYEVRNYSQFISALR